MGEVYKAVDTTLERTVALKILSQQFVQSTETIQRFLQEARAASSLNHPNIVTVHEIGTAEIEVGGTEAEPTMRQIRYIAMEFVEGETLRNLMDRGDLTLQKKIAVLAQAADGLAKAHKAGIVHRDLKPDNIMVTTDGFAKVLDFGLAKLVERDRPFTASAARNITQAGAVVGTIGYMAPEQVEGQAIDHRADIFSFGCMLYQAVTGRGPFETDSIVDTLHRIVHSEPEAVRRFTSVPAELVRVIEKSLRKKPEDRLQSMEEIAEQLHAVAQVIDPEAQVRRRSRVPWAAIGIGIAVIAAAATGYFFWARQRPRAFHTMKITAVAGTAYATAASLSPDGRYVVYASDDHGRQSLVVRQLATQTDVQLLPAADVHFVSCAFSPDGNYVYYVSADNRTDRGAAYRIATLGGSPQQLFDNIHAQVVLSPDARHLAYSAIDRGRGTSAVVIRQIDTLKESVVATRRLPDTFGAIAWSPDSRRLTYAVGNFAGGFHMLIAETEIATRKETPVASPRWRTIDSLAWLPKRRALIVNGRDQPAAARNQIWLLDNRGQIRRITNDLSDYETLAVTTDGRRIGTLQKTTVATLWHVPAADSGRARELSASGGTTDGMFGLTCIPAGVVYSADAGDSRDLWLARLTGAAPERLTDGKSDVYPSSSRDGRVVAFASMRSGRTNLWRLDPTTRQVAQITTGNFETSPSVTGDGRWVYFHTNRSGVRTVWRVPVAGGAPEQVTTSASSWPSVSADGQQFACSWFDRAAARVRIALIAATGGQPLRLLDIPVNSWLGGGNNHLVRWRAGAITYVSSEGGVSNVWSLPAAGNAPPARLTNFSEGQIFYFDWTPDGRDLVLSRGRVTSNVVTIDAF